MILWIEWGINMRVKTAQQFFLIIILFFSFLVVNAQSGFDIFKEVTGNIDLVIIGNGLHQRVNDPGVGDVTSIYDRNNTLNNNGEQFLYLDNDANATTFNSSIASYVIPIGHELVSVTLHVGGITNNNNITETFDPDDFTCAGLPNGPLSTATYDRREVKLSFDGGTNYTTLTADTFRNFTLNGNDVFTTAYDITPLAITGQIDNQLEITLADVLMKGPFISGAVAAPLGGWTAQIVTRDSGLSVNKTAIIYEGIVFTAGDVIDLSIFGFITPFMPTTGPKLTMMAGDGDLSAFDSVSFGPDIANLTPFADALHPANDMANSRGTFEAQYFTDLASFPRAPVRDRDVIDIIGIQTPAPELPPLSTDAILRVESVNEGITYHSFGLMFEVDPIDWGDAPDSYLTAGQIGTPAEGAAHLAIPPIALFMELKWPV